MKKITWTRIKEDFNLDSVPEVYFWKSQWESFDPHDHESRVSICYFLYRFFYMAFFIGAITNTFICLEKEDSDYYLIFLTNQTFILQLTYSVLFFLYVLWVVFRKSRQNSNNSNNNEQEESLNQSFHDDKYSLPIACKIIWIIFNILQVIPYVVTSIFWIFLFDESSHDTTCSTINNIMVHGVNSPMVLLDMFVVAVPMRRSHFIFPLVAAVWYSAFSGLYELFGGTYSGDVEYIYPMLDWKSKTGLAAGTCLGAFAGAIIIHFVMWNLYRLRVYVISGCTKSSQTI